MPRRALRRLAALAGLACLAGPAGAAPERVVSINLCTDQLAMLVAAPGQLVSVSRFARDPAQSAMPGAAAALPVNDARAEEVYLLAPDLVLASPFTDPATLSMLRRLDVPVAVLAPAYRLADIPALLAETGALLGREAAAAALAARFEAGLARHARPAGPEAPRAVQYGARGYAPGPRSLAGEIIAAAGLAAAAPDLGLGAHLPLERLVMLDPDMVILSPASPGASRADALLDHPALAALGARAAPRTDADWICGTPHVLAAIARLAAASDRLLGAPDPQ